MPAKGKPTPEAATWGRLAQKLGVTTQSLRAWSSLDGAPKGPGDVAAWQAFMEENNLGVAGNRVGKNREKLLEEQVELKNRILEIELKHRQRKTLEREEVNKLLFNVASRQRTALFEKLVNEIPPQAEGRTAAEIRVLLRTAADSICDVMTEEVSQVTSVESPASQDGEQSARAQSA